MTRTRLILLALLAALAVAAAGCGGGGGSSDSVPANDAAVVNGTAVTKADLQKELSRLKIAYKASGRTFPKVGTAEYQSLENNTLSDLVSRVERVQEATAMGITVTPAEVAQRRDQIKAQYFGGNEKKFVAGLKQQGYTVSEAEDVLKIQLISDKLVTRLTKDVKVDDAAVKKFYADNPTQFATPESREVRHILVKTKAQALDIRKQLLAGAAFNTLVKKYTLDAGSKSTGGRYNVVKGQMVAPFEKAAFALKTNEISQPVQTQYGFHIIQPLAPLKKGTTTPFTQAKAQIRSQLLQTKQSDTVKKWSDDLTKKYESKVSYAAGYQPPATATTTTTG